jgi:hypothetical protein
VVKFAGKYKLIELDQLLAVVQISLPRKYPISKKLYPNWI